MQDNILVMSHEKSQLVAVSQVFAESEEEQVDECTNEVQGVEFVSAECVSCA